MQKLIVSLIISIVVSFVLGCGVTPPPPPPPQASELPRRHRCHEYYGNAYPECWNREQLLKQLRPESERQKFDPADLFTPPAKPPEPPIPPAFPPSSESVMAPAPAPTN